MRVLYDQVIVMRDGVVLRHDLYTSDQQSPNPVILMRTPYGKQNAFRDRIYSGYQGLVKSGYSIIIQDVRGTGTSNGVLKSTAENEFHDGFDTIQAIASQPYCNGKVGMYGLSYFGFTQIAAAVEAPLALRCICPFEVAALVPFGSNQQRTLGGHHIYWLYGQAMGSLSRLGFSPEKETSVRSRLLENLQHMPDLLKHLPLRETPATDIKEVLLLQDYAELIDHVEDKSFWKRIHRPPDFSKLTTPMLHLTGWFDVALNGTLDNYTEACKKASPFCRDRQWVVIGPWEHGGLLAHEIEGENFGDAADGLTFDVPALMQKFMDAFLKDQIEPLQQVPRVQYFQMGENCWRTSNEWPPQQSTDTSLYLAPNGLLSDAPPQWISGTLCYEYDPANPYPSDVADEHGRHWLADRQHLLKREDVLTFRTPVYATPVKMAGRLRMRLFAASSAVDTDFVCIVGDEAPDGSVRQLGAGLTRGRFRYGPKPELLTPDRCECFEIEVGNVAYTLPSQHRLVVGVTSSYYPLHNVNLNDGLPSGWGMQPMIATQTVWMDKEHPSRLSIPILR